MPVEMLELQRGKGLSKTAIDRIGQAISGGQIIVLPAETSYAVGGDAFNHKVLQRLEEFQPDKPLALYIGSVAELRLYTVPLVPRVRRLLERLLPGPSAVVLRATQAAPRACVSRQGTIEIHLHGSQSYQMFYEAASRPLVGVSLPIFDHEEIARKLAESVDLMLLTDESLKRECAALLDFTKESPVALQGELPKWLQAGF